MKKTATIVLISTLFIFIGCGDNSNSETTNVKEIVKAEKEKPTVNKSDSEVNIDINDSKLNLQVGSKDDVNLNIGDKEGGVSINLGSFLK